MTEIKREITEEEYRKAIETSPDLLIPEYIHMGYGVYGSSVSIEGDKYYLTYTMGDSCD